MGRGQHLNFRLSDCKALFLFLCLLLLIRTIFLQRGETIFPNSQSSSEDIQGAHSAKSVVFTMV